METFSEFTERALKEAFQKASLQGVEMCRNAVTALLEKAKVELPDNGYHYVEGLRDAVEMIDTVHNAILEQAIREKTNAIREKANHEQASRKP